jgi:hypothetical protein
MHSSGILQNRPAHCNGDLLSKKCRGTIHIRFTLLIAHYITQLILHGNLIRSLAKSFGSAKNFARRPAESLRNHLLPDILPLPAQIRFQPP